MGATFDDGSAHDVAYVIRHPGFDSATLDHDLAVLVLAAPVAVPAIPPYDGVFDDQLVGEEIRLVGYGATSGAGDETYRKREGTTRIRDYDTSTFSFGAEPSQTCNGDSGGPAFFVAGGTEYLLGVTSRGDAACATGGTDIRVDAYLDDFLAPLLRATGDATAGPGQRCYFDDNCSAGACLAAIDEPTLSFCSPTCSDDLRCPAPLACSDMHRCVHPVPSPGTFGSRCSSGIDCVSGSCVTFDGAGSAVCTTRCFPLNDQPCADGNCVEHPDEPNRFTCEPAAPGGCSIAAGHTRAAFGCILLAALVVFGLRRRC